MAIGDIYQLTDFQVMQGQVCENVYFYRQTASDASFPSAKALSDMWNSQVRIAVTNIQVTTCVHNRYQVYNLFDPAELYDTPDSDAGARGGDSNPVFLAWGFGANRSDRRIRKSTRRIAGVAEGDVVNGSASGTIVPILATCAAAFNAQLVNVPVGGNNVFVPVAVKRILVEPVGKPSYYRLPENSGEAVWRTIANWGYERLTTQNSRKPGHGN